MNDLNTKLFRKAVFEVTRNESKTDILWLVVLKIRNWVINKWEYNGINIDRATSKWTKFKYGSKIFSPDEDRTIQLESKAFIPDSNDEPICWACRIIENIRKDDFAPRRWITEVGYKRISEDKAIISYVLSYSDMLRYIGPCEEEPKITLPRILKDLLSDNGIVCTVGENKLSLSPIFLKPGDYPFFEEFIKNPSREIPIVYISPRTKEQKEIEANQIDIPALAIALAGNALVFYANNEDFSEEMKLIGDKRYICYAGAMRVFMPHPNPDDESDGVRHRILLHSYIQELGWNKIIAILSKAFSQDLYYQETKHLIRVEDCIILNRESSTVSHIVELAESVSKHKENADIALGQAIQEEEKKLELQQEIELLERDLEAYKEEADVYKSRLFYKEELIEHYKTQVQYTTSLEQGLLYTRSLSAYPSSYKDVALYFISVFRDRIDFSEKGISSLSSCRTRIEVLWEALFNMCTVLYELHDTSDPVYESNFRNRTGWDVARGEGAQTRNSAELMRQYDDWYKGYKITIERHVKRGTNESDPKFVRIYYDFIPELRLIVIGHCGKHLKNYQTQFVH